MKHIKTGKLIIIFLALVLLLSLSGVSLSKYVISGESHLVGIYTDFVLTHNGSGQSVVIRTDENGSKNGYVSLSVNNFKDEKVSKRNVRFTLRMPTSSEMSAGKVVDAWGNECPVEKDSNLYTISVVNEKGEEYSSSELSAKCVLPANKRAQSSLLLKIRRNSTAGEFSQSSVERISVVLETSEPYKDLQVFTIVATSARLSVGVTSGTYQGFSEEYVNVKSSIDFTLGKEAADAAYTAKLVLDISGDVIFDSYRFEERYGKIVSVDAVGEKYTVTIDAGADIDLHFYVSGKGSVAMKAYIDDGIDEEEKISGIGEDGVVFSVLG